MTIAEIENKKSKTVLRTFRLSSALDAALTSRAQKKKVGKNALVASVLNKYVEWDSIVGDFGYIAVPWEMIAKFIGSLDKETLGSIARQVGTSVASSIPLWFGSADLDSVLKYMETSVKYSGAGVQQRIERQGNIARIIVYQPFDENGVAWARGFNLGLVESIMGYPPKIITHANSIETIIEAKDSA